jgi:hypothetical protein
MVRQDDGASFCCHEWPMNGPPVSSHEIRCWILLPGQAAQQAFYSMGWTANAQPPRVVSRTAANRWCNDCDFLMTRLCHDRVVYGICLRAENTYALITAKGY